MVLTQFSYKKQSEPLREEYFIMKIGHIKIVNLQWQEVQSPEWIFVECG